MHAGTTHGDDAPGGFRADVFGRNEVDIGPHARIGQRARRVQSTAGSTASFSRRGRACTWGRRRVWCLRREAVDGVQCNQRPSVYLQPFPRAREGTVHGRRVGGPGHEKGYAYTRRRRPVTTPPVFSSADAPGSTPSIRSGRSRRRRAATTDASGENGRTGWCLRRARPRVTYRRRAGRVVSTAGNQSTACSAPAALGSKRSRACMW